MKAEAVCGLEIANEIALMSDQIDQTYELLSRVKKSPSTGLKVNGKKMKVMAYNDPRDEKKLKTMNGVELEVVEDIKWCGRSHADPSARKKMSGVYGPSGVHAVKWL